MTLAHDYHMARLRIARLEEENQRLKAANILARSREYFLTGLLDRLMAPAGLRMAPEELKTVDNKPQQT